MKTTKPLLLLLSLTFTLCCLTACEKDNESLSSIKEAALEGEAPTLEISMNGNDWQIASVIDLYGQNMYDNDNKPMRLEDLGSLHFKWGTISRDKQDALTIALNDNFDEADRAFIINIELRTGLYKEQITIRQKRCQSFYRIESMIYTLEEGDGVKVAATRPWGFTYIDRRVDPGQTITLTYYPINVAEVDYSFKYQTAEFHHNWLSPKKEDRDVSMPKDIENGKIIFEEEKRSYADKGIYRDELMDKPYDVDIVSWKRNRLSADLYYKRLQVTYTMTVSRLGSDALKTVKGKLIKEFPYDCSPIRNQISELQEDD